MTATLRKVAGAAVSLAVILGINLLAAWLIHDTNYDNFASLDGCVILFTLIVPSLAGGFAGALVARDPSMYSVTAALIVFAVTGWIHPFWRIPLVSPDAAHSAVIHYLIYNPITALAFGTLGGWFGTQFAVGQFTMDDRTPFVPKGLED